MHLSNDMNDPTVCTIKTIVENLQSECKKAYTDKKNFLSSLSVPDFIVTICSNVFMDMYLGAITYELPYLKHKDLIENFHLEIAHMCLKMVQQLELLNADPSTVQ
jgi:hypothetical protein